MAFPTVVQRTTGEQATDSATHVINVPTATAGNYIWCYFVSDCNTADVEYVTVSIDSGAGWELIRQDGNGNFNCVSALLRKLATGSDALTLRTAGITATQQSTHICSEIAGSNDYAVTLTVSSGGSNPNSGAVVGEDSTQDYLLELYRGGDNTVVPSAAPTNYANLTSDAATNAAGASSSIMDRSLNGTGDDPGTMTCTTEQWCLYLVCHSPLIDISATIAQTTTKAAQAAAGTESMTGTIAQTTTIPSQAASGTETISGTIAQEGPNAEQAATGQETITGTISQTTTPASQAASGTETITGAIDQTTIPATQSAAGTESITGDITQEGPNAEQAAEGTHTDTPAGPGTYGDSSDAAWSPASSDGADIIEPVTMQFRDGKFQKVASEPKQSIESKPSSKEPEPEQNTSLTDKLRALSDIPFESLTQPVVQQIEQQLDPYGFAPFFPNQDPEFLGVPIVPQMVMPLPEMIDLVMFENQSKEEDWLIIMALIESGDI